MRAAGRAGCRVVLVASACCRATAWIRCAACRAVVGRGGRGGRACVRARARGARPATRSPFSRHDGMHAAAGNQPVRLHACSSRGQYSGAHSVASRRAGDDKMGEDLCVCVCVGAVMRACAWHGGERSRCCTVVLLLYCRSVAGGGCRL